MRATPPEINIKIEAWNTGQRRAAQRDYNFVVLMATAWHSPKKFPSFEQFYPEKILVNKPISNAEARTDLRSLQP